MKRQAYQHPELRDANDSIIQEGTYGKTSPLVNSTNDGVLDYINNNLEALYDNINGSRIYVANKAALPATGDLSAMYIAEDTGKWYLWDGQKYIETDNARKIADEAIAARDAAKASANDAANSAREQQADWKVTDSTSKAFIKNKPAVYPRANLLDPQLYLSNRVTTMNTSYGDSTLRYFNATGAIVDGTKEIPDAHILHMAWDNGKACDAQLAIATGSKNIPGSMYFRTQDNNWATVGWMPWKEVACKDDTIAKATADAAGNDIQATYAKKSDLSSSVSTTSLTVTGQTSVPTANAGDSSKAIANTAYVQGELTNYLPLSGGTMTGWLSANADEFRILNSKAEHDGMVSVFGGSGTATGANLSLYGTSHSSQAGRFVLSATDGANIKSLRGQADGTLTWNNKDVERVNARGSNYIRYESGLQLCWGIVGSGTSFTVTYPVAFNAEPSIATSSDSNVTIGVSVSGRQNTGFVATLSASSYMRYIAIGKWK